MRRRFKSVVQNASPLAGKICSKSTEATDHKHPVRLPWERRLCRWQLSARGTSMPGRLGHGCLRAADQFTDALAVPETVAVNRGCASGRSVTLGSFSRMLTKLDSVEEGEVDFGRLEHAVEGRAQSRRRFGGRVLTQWPSCDEWRSLFARPLAEKQMSRCNV
jgi:hypothetical protein